MVKYLLVDAKCQDCGNIVSISSNVTGIFKRCPTCRSNKRQEREKLRQVRRTKEMTLQPSRTVSDYNIGGEYHITKDPDKSWGEDSSFTWDEIERMLVDRFLTVGTEFRVEPNTNATLRVVDDDGKLHLRSIAALNKSMLAQLASQKSSAHSVSHWRRKKLCHRTIIV